MNSLPQVLLVATREIANLVLLGGLFFLLFVQLPAIRRMRSPRVRLALRKASFGRIFAWGWVGLLLLWSTAGYELLSMQTKLPVHTGIAVLLAMVFTLLFLLGQFGLYMQAVIALEDGNTERASWLHRMLGKLLVVAFVLALCSLMFQQLGPAVMSALESAPPPAVSAAAPG